MNVTVSLHEGVISGPARLVGFIQEVLTAGKQESAGTKMTRIRVGYNSICIK